MKLSKTESYLISLQREELDELEDALTYLDDLDVELRQNWKTVLQLQVEIRKELGIPQKGEKQ